MADNELRRRRLKIIQVLLLVDDLEDEKEEIRNELFGREVGLDGGRKEGYIIS